MEEEAGCFDFCWFVMCGVHCGLFSLPVGVTALLVGYVLLL